MTLGVSLWIDGVKVADGTPGEDATVPYAVDGLTISWGRPTTVDQPDASSCTFDLVSRTDFPDPDLFGSTVTIGRRVDVLATSISLPRATVFVGSITDVSMVVADDDPDALTLTVTCDDLLADLNNRPAASQPWPVESVAARFAHVLAAARLGTTYSVASDLAGIPVKRIDVDAGQTSMVAAMLADIATSVDGVLWSAGDANADPMLWLESPAQRAPLRRLAYVPPWIVILDVPVAAGALLIDPCVPDLDPIEWRQTMSDLVTGVAVTYYIPDPDDPTKDAGVTLTVADPAEESPGKPWGVRRMTLDSQLTTSADAGAVASKLLARLSTPSWRLNNIVVDQASPVTLPDADMRRILDVRTRHGVPILLSPLPAWSPPAGDTFSGYLEGGDITSTAGIWSCSLWISLAQGYAGVSASWADLPDPRLTSTWTYATVAADGTYRWANTAKVLTIAFIDSAGVNLTAALSGIVPGDGILLTAAEFSWSAVVTVNVVGTDKVQLTVTGITGSMPPVGTLAQISASPAGHAVGPWRWADVDPDMSWLDLTGAGGPL